VTGDPALDPLLRLTMLAAARIHLRHPDPLLHAMLRPLLPEIEPTALSAAIARQSELLFSELGESHHPLALVARGCGLSAFDVDLLGLAFLPCLDDRAGRAVQTIAGQRRLPAGLGLRVLLGDAPIGLAARTALWTSPLWRHSLLTLPDPQQPAAERLLDPNPTLLAVLEGAMPCLLGGWAARALVPVAPPASLVDAVVATMEWIQAPSATLLHLAGDPDRTEAVFVAAADRLGRGVVLFDAPQAVGAAPWRELALAALATGKIAALSAPAVAELTAPPLDLCTPVALLAAPKLYLRLLLGQPPATRVVLPPPDPVEQAEAWRMALPSLTEVEADTLGNQTWMTRADIAAIAARVGDPGGIAAARLAHAPPRPVRMATIDATDTPWSRLVVDDLTATRLEDLISRYRLRVPVRFRWGMRYAPRGLIALLSGDSGVGKTLAAEAVAARLGLPILRVDLSLVVSKYIGETEKNLAELFACAEGFAALLFFDEADALFGKRTAVEDAHDRYANIEVNYLLQRLEAFEGIALLATNAAQGVDAAFLRRFDLVLSMPRPGPTQRHKLWAAHLPDDRVDAGIDLGMVADRFDLTGGEIRNAALASAFAAAAGDGSVTPDLLAAAIRTEFAKKGRPAPAWPAGGST
jgi:ATPase family associated with various cellular activities (AAA)